MPLAGIDVHVHVHDARARALQGPEAEAKAEQMARYFKREARHTSVEEQAEQYRSRDMMAVLVN
nr:4-hydroxyphenyl-beta-ketoacyl-CoA hydrolase [Actinomycetota bacterium]